MLTKSQKQQHVELGAKKIGDSQTLIFADFSGVATKDINTLKAQLKKSGASFKVLKKRLLKIALKNAGIEFDLGQFKAPVATIFASGDLSSVAAPIYAFSRELAKRKINFKIVGGFDRSAKAPVTAAEFLVIAKLPSREVLLAQILGGFTSPVRAFLSILSQLSEGKGKKVEAAA